MKTYAIRGTRTKLTGHLRQDGTRTTFCNRPIGTPNDIFRSLTGWKMCTRCVTAESRDRAEATVTATAALDPATTGTLPVMVCTQHGTDCDHNPKRRHSFRPAARAPHPIETYTAYYCHRHGEFYPCPSKNRHDYASCGLTPDEAARIEAGDVPTRCCSDREKGTPGWQHLRDVAAEESRYAAELITEAEATAGTWRGAWIGDTTALFDRPVEQGALFA